MRRTFDGLIRLDEGIKSKGYANAKQGESGNPNMLPILRRDRQSRKHIEHVAQARSNELDRDSHLPPI